MGDPDYILYTLGIKISLSSNVEFVKRIRILRESRRTVT
jgi:hypothetical protein